MMGDGGGGLRAMNTCPYQLVYLTPANVVCEGYVFTVIPFTGLGGGGCVAGGVCLGPDPGWRLRGLAQGVVYAHTQGEVGGLARGCLGPYQGDRLRGLARGVSRPGWRLRGLARGGGVSRPRPSGEVGVLARRCQGPHPGGGLGFGKGVSKPTPKGGVEGTVGGWGRGGYG